MNIHTNNISWTKIKHPLIKETLHISTTPITVSQFYLFIKSNGYKNLEYWSTKGKKWLLDKNITCPKYWNNSEYYHDDFPVTGISYWEAEAFAKFSGARLLDETEWTLLCSNFNTSQYPWGNAPASKSYTNLSFFGRFSKNEITEVHKYKNGINQYGLMDLIGNVSEWCTYNSADKNKNTKTAILKGGCFWHTPIHVDCHSRDVVLCDTRDNQTGIRLVLNKKISIEKTTLKKGNQPPPLFTNKLISRPTKPFRQEGLPDDQEISKWKLKIFGKVKNELSLDYKDIKSLPSTTVTGLFVCVCRWADENTATGVSIKEILKLSNPTAPISQLYLVFISMKGSNGKRYMSSVPLSSAIKNEGILCYNLDNSTISKELGFPLRYIDFNLYGYKQVKCIEMIEISRTQVEGYWEKEMQYDIDGRIQAGSVTVIGKDSYKKEIY